jgi:asparagine synthase (glutamine-hydrolysing)
MENKSVEIARKIGLLKDYLMCGIFGVWNYRTKKSVDRETLVRCTNSMTHRGPDDLGTFYDDKNGIGLGFRRLSIIDLSPTGHQPMCNEDGRLWIVFNGEIYNFLDLKDSLESKGHLFHSRTDTEVILHQYEEQGSDCFKELNGMFGIGIWDNTNRQLLLARDRVGKKPVYFYDDGNRIIFASELKAIVADRSVPRRLNPKAVTEYIGTAYIGGSDTIFQGIQKLPPAHFMTVNEQGQIKIARYWDWLPAFEIDQRLSEQDWGDLLRQTLTDSVRCRMMSDVPLGAFLSGGMDSSTVVALMAGLSSQPVKTFSIGFEDEPFNELPFARKVAEKFHTEHHEFIVQPEAIENILPKIVHQMDEPFADPSLLPTYYVAKISRDLVTVCLTGDGGDEVFGGYTRYAQALDRKKMDSIPLWLRKLLLTPLAWVIPPYERGNRRAFYASLSASERYPFYMQVYFSSRARYILQPEYASHVPRLPGNIYRAVTEASHLDYLSKIQYADVETYLPDDILVKVDRTSMLNSLETRCPLLDYRLMELAARIPPNLRIKDGIGKYILKQAMRGIVPNEVIDRPKMGFGIPGLRWMKEDSSNFVNDFLSPAAISKRGVFKAKSVEKVIQHCLNTTPEQYEWPQLWTLLIFELWCQEVYDA